MKSLIVAIGSAIVGAIVAGVVIVALRRPDDFGTQYPGMLRAVTAEHVLHAKLLREGQSSEVLRMIESTFPSSVLHFDMFKLHAESDIVQLWRIREYGEKHRIEYPPAVAALLANLPPKPAAFCDITEGANSPKKSPAPTPGSVAPRTANAPSK